MSAKLNDDDRATLAGLADLIAPRWNDMPSAGDIGLTGEPLDRALKTRPDLVGPLSSILAPLRGQPPGAALEALESDDPASFHTLLIIVAGAYYMTEQVRAALGYTGQQAQSLPRDGFGAEELAMEMMQQPARYRQAE